ncbi:hypothetical protein [Polaribacter porphyrae]|nr:hypothetical protein [Polaribacter porphyrae]
MFGILALSFDTKDFFPEITYIFYLIIIVFLGQMWMSFKSFLSKNKLKSFILFITLTLLFAFTISKIEVINNESIDKSILSKNFLYKYNIQRVTSNSFTKIPDYKPFFFDIYVTKNKLITNSDVRDSIIKTRSLKEQILDFQSNFSSLYHPYLSYILHIDKNTSMLDVKNLHNNLKELKARKIYYSLKDKNIPFYFSTNKAFGFILKNSIIGNTNRKLIKIKILNKIKVRFENNTISMRKLKELIEQKILNEGISPFVLLFNEHTSFESYFKVLSLTRDIVNKFRNDYAEKSYNTSYQSLSKELKTSVRDKYYWKFVNIMN